MASAWEVRPLYCSAAQYYLYSSTTFILLDLWPCAGIEPDLYTLEPKVADLYTFDRFEVGTPGLHCLPGDSEEGLSCSWHATGRVAPECQDDD